MQLKHDQFGSSTTSLILSIYYKELVLDGYLVKSTHSWNEPSFFHTRKTMGENGEEYGRAKPFSMVLTGEALLEGYLGAFGYCSQLYFKSFKCWDTGLYKPSFQKNLPKTACKCIVFFHVSLKVMEAACIICCARV